MTTPQKVDLARRIVKQERGLKKLPPADHSAVVETAKMKLSDLRRRLKDAEEPQQLSLDPAFIQAAVEAVRRPVVQYAPSGPQFLRDPNALSPHRPAPMPRRAAPTPITKKQPHGRIIRVIPLGNGRQRVLHATRGWREERA